MNAHIKHNNLNIKPQDLTLNICGSDIIHSNLVMIYFQLSLSAAVKSYKIPSFKMNTDSISNTTAFTVML